MAIITLSKFVENIDTRLWYWVYTNRQELDNYLLNMLKNTINNKKRNSKLKFLKLITVDTNNIDTSFWEKVEIYNHGFMFKYKEHYITLIPSKELNEHEVLKAIMLCKEK